MTSQALDKKLKNFPNLSKEDVIHKLSLRHPALAKEKVKKAVDSIFEILTGALLCKDKVELRGFGSFVLKVHKNKNFRNPKTNEMLEPKTSFSVQFRLSRELQNEIQPDT